MAALLEKGGNFENTLRSTPKNLTLFDAQLFDCVDVSDFVKLKKRDIKLIIIFF